MKQTLVQGLWQAYRGATWLFVAGVGLVLYLVWGYKQKKA